MFYYISVVYLSSKRDVSDSDDVTVSLRWYGEVIQGSREFLIHTYLICVLLMFVPRATPPQTVSFQFV